MSGHQLILTGHLTTQWVVTPLPSPSGKTVHMATTSPDKRPPTLPQSTYSLKEAADQVCRSTKTILRWCRDGTFPSAEKVPGPKGDEWSIPSSDLAAVVVERGLVIDLTTHDQTVSTHESTQNEDLIEALNAVAELSGQIGQLSGQNEQLERHNKRLGSDNDHLRAEYERTQSLLTESERARGQLEGQLERAHDEAEQAEKLRAEIAQERDSLGDKYSETAKSLSEASTDLEHAKNDTQTVAGERDELAAKLADAEASMGWWTRRKYNRG